jgi:nitrate reductase gamma subunit
VLSTIAYIIAYAAVFLFLSGIVVKVVRYERKPLHLRWELYPVAHEGSRAKYGGSYLEEIDWVKKPRSKSMAGELGVMLPEIFCLKAIYESNRPMWVVTYPFHLGVYCTAAFLFVLFANAGIELIGLTAVGSWGMWTLLLNCLGLLGFSLSIIGALGLVFRRASDVNLRDYTSSAHFFNLGWFVAAMGLALGAWFMDGYSFESFRSFVYNLVTFNIREPVNLSVSASVILGAALAAYIPWTHMAHFFMKYYLYHDIRWGDEPMVGEEQNESKLREVLNYKPTWAADYVRADGRKTWVDVVMENPAREKPKE